MILKFNEDLHKYYLENEDDSPLLEAFNKPFVSVSKFLETFVDPFDEAEQAEKFVTSKNNKLGLSSAQEVLDYWEKRRNLGTAAHNRREGKDIEQGAFSYKRDNNGHKICYTRQELMNLPLGVHTELTVFLMSAWLIGTADKMTIYLNEKGERTIDCLDYKGLALDTEIPTDIGWVTMGEVKKGDTIFDGDGNLTKVKNVSEIHYNPCYKIIFDTNEEIVCDHEHRWEVIKRNKGRSENKNITVSTEELKEIFDAKDSTLKIPISKLNTEDVNLPLDPYILGLWLGDGNRTSGTITCCNQYVWDEIKRRGFEVSVDHNRNDEKGAESRTIFGISTHLRELNLLSNKHIPEIYMRSSNYQRLELLRGFMDADGYFNRKRNRVVCSTTKEWQAKGIAELANSLGFKTTIIPYIGSGFGKINIPMYSVCFTPDINPFLCRNTDFEDVIRKNTKISTSPRTNNRFIKSIELVETVPTKCIEVESETHTYLATRGLIKTHNSNGHKLVTEPKKFFQKEKGCSDFKYFYAPINHRPCDTFQKYTYQLSTYCYFMEKLGYKIGKLEIEAFDMDDDGNETNVRILPVEYRRDDVKLMIEYYLKQKK